MIVYNVATQKTSNVTEKEAAELTQDEKEAMSEPTAEERLAALEEAMLEMLGVSE